MNWLSDPIARRDGNARSEQGFTLVEILVVLSIVAAGLTLFAISMRPAAFNPSEAARAIADLAREARLVSNRTGQVSTIRVDVQRNVVELVQNNSTRRTVALPADAELAVLTGRDLAASATRGEIRFLSFGGATGGEIRVGAHNSNNASVVVINWLTGGVDVDAAR